MRVNSPKGKLPSREGKLQNEIEKSLAVPVVLDICWKRVEVSEVSREENSDTGHREKDGHDPFSQPVLEDRSSLLAYLSGALQMVITSFLTKGRAKWSSDFGDC